jgi:hypothetical protein
MACTFPQFGINNNMMHNQLLLRTRFLLRRAAAARRAIGSRGKLEENEI